MHKRLVWILVAALIGFASAQAPQVAKVGSLMSFTGALAEFGPAIENGVNEKLKGKAPKAGTPKAGATGTPVKNGFFDAIYKNQVKR